MTNKEKRQYLDLSESFNLHLYNDNNILWKNLDKKIPETLYKFRNFDKYTFEMIDKNYVYLASAKDLDDPFDCLIRHDVKNLYKNNESSLSTNIIKFIVSEIINDIEYKNCVEKDLFNLFKLYLQKNLIKRNLF